VAILSLKFQDQVIFVLNQANLKG